MVAARTLMPFLLVLLLACACSPDVPSIRQAEDFAPRPEKDTIFVVPFLTVMVPAEMREGIFDRFVDVLNSGSEGLDYEFVIIKGEPDDIDADWLAQQHYLTGEIFGYLEESGCCSTVIQVNSRVRLHQPGSAEPTLVLSYPREVFFDHDYSTIEAERAKLADDIATTLAQRFLAALAGR